MFLICWNQARLKRESKVGTSIVFILLSEMFSLISSKRLALNECRNARRFLLIAWSNSCLILTQKNKVRRLHYNFRWRSFIKMNLLILQLLHTRRRSGWETVEEDHEVTTLVSAWLAGVYSTCSWRCLKLVLLGRIYSAFMALGYRGWRCFNTRLIARFHYSPTPIRLPLHCSSPPKPYRRTQRSEVSCSKTFPFPLRPLKK